MTNVALSRALLRRELTLPWLAMLIVLASVAAYAGLQPPLAADGDFASRLLRRADLTLIAVTALLAAGHVTQRIASDRHARWPGPWVAAGGSPLGYAFLVIGAIALARWAWVSAFVVAFAVAGWLSTGSVELLVGAPALVLVAALLLLCITSFAALFALLLREPIPALLLALVAGLTPLLAASLHELRTGATPSGVMRVWILCCTPPVQLADSVRAAVTDSLSLALLLLLVGVLSRRVIGVHA